MAQAQAQRTARAGPSKVARNPSPSAANPTTRVLNRRSMVAWAYPLNIFILTIIGPRDAASILDHRVTETAHWLAWQHWADPILQKPYDIKDGLIHTRRARHRLGME
jgi:hypothetical protein